MGFRTCHPANTKRRVVDRRTERPLSLSWRRRLCRHQACYANRSLHYQERTRFTNSISAFRRFSWWGLDLNGVVARDGLATGTVTEIYTDRQGRLWLASPRSGVTRVDHPESEHPSFSVYTTAQQLSSNNVQVITEDEEGYIYIGGGRGLDRLDPA